jgi:hypothetical protein
MKAVISIAILFFACFFAGESCKKSASCTGSGGGKGGNATINITPEHLAYLIDSCTIYIKYGTLDAPANGIYDDSTKCVMVDTTPVATFPGLKPGLYYFYGVGYHTGYSPPYVKGAANYTICKEQVINIYLPTYSYLP